MITDSSDEGSATVEFVALGVPAFVLILIVFQLIYTGYLSLVAFDAASESASVAALADGTDALAEETASRVVSQLTGVALAAVSVSHQSLGESSVSKVRVGLSSPILVLGALPVTQTVEAVDEPRQ